MIWQQPIVLASGSPRRLQLLQSTGWEVLVHPPSVDDARLKSRDVPARAWVAAMAWLKARSVIAADDELVRNAGTILAADTVCELDDTILGQPSTVEEARSMIRGFRNRPHRVLTGVCLVRPDGSRRRIFTDEATVTLGDLPDGSIEAYLQSDLWRGKAGGYNLFDRLADGWPLTWVGDESTVVGLPMRKLKKLIAPADACQEGA
jgi:septum formation protein